MAKYTFLITAIMLLLHCSIHAQSAFDVSGSMAETYSNPFGGGMNAMQFGEVDINRDGIKDLIAFDRNGNRLMPFINGGNAGSIDYNYAPEYIDAFPEFAHWVIFKDYNLDGRNDIFTYNSQIPGIIVYKNTSTDELRFDRVVYPYLTSWYGSGYINILVTMVDYPGISDLDGDGDLDILTFWALGSFVEMQKNMSMELYGHADSLVFELTTRCWGEFAENEESNQLYLDTCQASDMELFFDNGSKDRHTGSTFQLTDLDNNGTMDLLLGDVDYPQVIKLMNDGTPEYAHIGSYEQAFPDETDPSWIYSLPVTAIIDVNNDGKDDLMVSPFDPNPLVTQNHKSVWLYLNEGSNAFPDWKLHTKKFLQRDMIDCGSGAYPAFADINLDGLQDMIIGNWGYYQSSWYDVNMALHSEYDGAIALFMNKGSIDEPYFEFVTDDFGFIRDMDILGPAPAFGDIDTDDDADMIVGRDDGTLLFYRNCSCLGNPEDFTLELENYQDIDVGDYSTPFIFDLDEDGLLDLIIGEKAGNINFYKNTGDIYDPVFTFVTDSLGKINVTDPGLSYYGYSTPYLFRATDGTIRLLSGSEQGEIFYYDNIEGNLAGKFNRSDELWKEVDSLAFDVLGGLRTAPAIADLNDDVYLDLAIGNFSGGLNMYSTALEPEVTMTVDDPVEKSQRSKLIIFPNPASHKIHLRFEEYDPSMPYTCEVRSISGQQLLASTFAPGSDLSMDVSMLQNGIYLLILRKKGEPGFSSVSKLMINR